MDLDAAFLPVACGELCESAASLRSTVPPKQAPQTELLEPTPLAVIRVSDKETTINCPRLWDRSVKSPRRADHHLRTSLYVGSCPPKTKRSDCIIKNMFNFPIVTSCVSSDFRASSSSTKMECRLSTVCLHRVHHLSPSSARPLPVACTTCLQEALPPYAASPEKPTATVFIVICRLPPPCPLKFFNRPPATCTASSTPSVRTAEIVHATAKHLQSEPAKPSVNQRSRHLNAEFSGAQLQTNSEKHRSRFCRR